MPQVESSNFCSGCCVVRVSFHKYAYASMFCNGSDEVHVCLTVLCHAGGGHYNLICLKEVCFFNKGHSLKQCVDHFYSFFPRSLFIQFLLQLDLERGIWLEMFTGNRFQSIIRSNCTGKIHTFSVICIFFSP